MTQTTSIKHNPHRGALQSSLLVLLKCEEPRYGSGRLQTFSALIRLYVSTNPGEDEVSSPFYEYLFETP